MNTYITVLPLVKDDELVGRARSIVHMCRRNGLYVSYDDEGGIVRRYHRHDGIGTPLTVTIDYDTLSNGTVAVRTQDCTEFSRAHVYDLVDIIMAGLDMDCSPCNEDAWTLDEPAILPNPE